MHKGNEHGVEWGKNNNFFSLSAVVKFDSPNTIWSYEAHVVDAGNTRTNVSTCCCWPKGMCRQRKEGHRFEQPGQRC